MSIKDKILDQPRFYNFVQRILAGRLVDTVHSTLDAGFITTDKGCKILDVGCGPGRYAEWYSGNYTGIDLNEVYIQSASKNMQEKRFFVADACDFDLPDKDFDVAVSIGLYHHLSDDQMKRSIACVLRHLKKSSRYYVFDAVLPRRFWANIPGYILRKNDRGQYVRHPDYYQNVIKDFGFKIETCQIGRAGMLDYIFYVISN